MYPLTENFPKPLLEVAGKPVLDYLMDQLVELPLLQDIHIVTNARFISHFEKWQQKWLAGLASKSLSIALYNDGSTNNGNRRGAVADLSFVLEKLPDHQPALIAAGDNIFRFPLLPIWQNFVRESHNCIVALPESDLEKLHRTGVLEIDEDGLVNKLHEKPENPPSKWTCPALYFLQPNALQHVADYLARPEAKDAPGHFIAYLVSKEKIYAAKVNGTRFDIGSMASYREANEILRRETAIISN
jgi:glucose-1-phosphate thymidylyltransferase